MTNDEHDDMTSGRTLVEGDITNHRAPVARISYLSQDRPCLKSASMQVCCAIANPTTSDREVKRIGRYLVAKPRAECFFRWQRWRELEACLDADWSGDRPTRRSVSAGVVMRGGHCLKVWAGRQEQSASESLGIQSVLSPPCFVFMMIEQSCVLDVEHRTTFRRHVAHQAGPLCAFKRNIHDRHSHLNMDIWSFW